MDTANVLAHGENGAVVHLSGRQFPAFAMQGDTLASLVHRLELVLKELLEESVGRDLVQEAVDELRARVLFYGKTLKKHGFTLPY